MSVPEVSVSPYHTNQKMEDDRDKVDDRDDRVDDRTEDRADDRGRDDGDKGDEGGRPKQRKGFSILVRNLSFNTRYLED